MDEKTTFQEFLVEFKNQGDEDTTSKPKTKEWRRFMSETDRLLSQIEKGSVKIPKDIKFTTNAAHTELIASKSKGFEVGDKFEGFIQAKDHLGRNKPYGGDYFRVRFVPLI